MRYAIAVLAIACLVGAGFLVDGHFAANSTDNGPDWRRREEQFLKAALDRVEQDIARQPVGAGAIATLYGERREILGRIAALAGPALPDKAPQPDTGAPVQAESPPAVPQQSAAPMPPPELRAGSALARRPHPGDTAELVLDQDLRGPIILQAAHRRPRPAKHPEIDAGTAAEPAAATDHAKPKRQASRPNPAP